MDEMKAADTHYTLRQLTAKDVSIYKKMRLEALYLEPEKYSVWHAEESILPDSYWLAKISNPHAAYFGLFINEVPIGITGIIIDKNNPETALMMQSYIRAVHRGKGLSRMLYDARISWAQAHGLKRLLVGHRESNIISKAAIQHFNFKYAYSEPRAWPDGITEDILYYELLL
ncbi:MAG: GNAT family N-acetyltransferase [Flavipsychrobacter sp.]|nr:GNAT family N-acetyltransferase [Flavipsychrobacter sp.]